MKKIILLLLILLNFSCSNNTNVADSNCNSESPQYFVTINNQVWTSKNLDVTTYCDGTIIPQVESNNGTSDEWINLRTGAWTYVKNCNCGASYIYSTTELHSFGKLYNWYALAGIHDQDPNTPNKKLVPDGWRIPTLNDFNILFSNNTSASLRTTGITSNGSGLWMNSTNMILGTNTTGFSALPAGFKAITNLGNQNGGYGNAGYYAYFWTSDFSNEKAKNVVISTRSIPNEFETQETDFRAGFSVRLIKSQ